MVRPLDRAHYEGNVLDEIASLQQRVDALERLQFTNWKGSSASDFDTTTLPNTGDYGYQTTDDEVQINVGGEIRAISTSAL